MNLFLPIVLGLIFILIYGAFFIVKQQTAAIIETFGRFSSVKQSGLQVKIHCSKNFRKIKFKNSTT